MLKPAVWVLKLKNICTDSKAQLVQKDTKYFRSSGATQNKMLNE